MTPAEVLKKVRDRIEDPRHWVQGFAAARPFAGAMLKCHPSHPDATAWCMMGALAGTIDSQDQYDCVVRTLRKTTGGNITKFNDYHSHAEVLQAIDAAILYCEGGGDSLPTDSGRCLLGSTQGEAPVAP